MLFGYPRWAFLLNIVGATKRLTHILRRSWSLRLCLLNVIFFNPAKRSKSGWPELHGQHNYISPSNAPEHGGKTNPVFFNYSGSCSVLTGLRQGRFWDRTLDRDQWTNLKVTAWINYVLQYKSWEHAARIHNKLTNKCAKNQTKKYRLKSFIWG